MKQAKSALIPVSALFMLSIFGFSALYNAGYIPNGLDLFIFAMIMIAGIYAFVVHMKRYKDLEQGITPDDELSNQIKYKAGYYSFLVSMYLWLFIFMFQRYFPDVETMLGGGILLSGIIAMGMRAWMARHLDEYSD